MDSKTIKTIRKQLIELRTEHKDLDNIIADMLGESPCDFIKVQRLKKKKLNLKDQIQKIESSIIPDIIA